MYEYRPTAELQELMCQCLFWKYGTVPYKSAEPKLCSLYIEHMNMNTNRTEQM